MAQPPLSDALAQEAVNALAANNGKQTDDIEFRRASGDCVCPVCRKNTTTALSPDPSIGKATSSSTYYAMETW